MLGKAAGVLGEGQSAIGRHRCRTGDSEVGDDLMAVGSG
uniref:Uncharacterized protein n=1 Tax=Arundo donax TaxID=35708 RepID=A0A0A9FVM6_ARUDO